MEDQDKLQERVGQFRKRIKEFAEGIGKEYRLLKEPIRQRAQDILKEMERAIDRMGERLKKTETGGEHQLRKSKTSGVCKAT